MRKPRILFPAVTLALATAWSGAAHAQVRQAGEVARTLAIGPPELACTIQISSDPSGANAVPQGRTIALGSSLWVHFTVANKGLAPANGFVSLIKVEKTVTYPGTLVHQENPTQQPLTLGVGQTTTLPPVRVDLDPGVDNDIDARMFVDHGNAVAEADEGNNWCNRDFTAQGAAPSKPKQQLASQAQPAPAPMAANRAEPGAEPAAHALEMDAAIKALVTPEMADLWCSANGSKNEDGTGAVPNGATITVDPPVGLYPPPVYLQVTVRNSGQVQAGGVVVKVTIERNGQKIDEPTKTLIVGPGLSYRWPILVGLIGTGLAPQLGGTNHIKASVVSDGANAVPEMNEANNQCATQFTAEWSKEVPCPLCGLGDP